MEDLIKQFEGVTMRLLYDKNFADFAIAKNVLLALHEADKTKSVVANAILLADEGGNASDVADILGASVSLEEARNAWRALMTTEEMVDAIFEELQARGTLVADESGTSAWEDVNQSVREALQVVAYFGCTESPHAV